MYILMFKSEKFHERNIQNVAWESGRSQPKQKQTELLTLNVNAATELQLSTL